MKSKPNWSEIEGRIDFGSVNQKLAQFAMSGAGRRKTVTDLLEKVKDALIQARSNGVSYRALAAFLKESGLPVSEPTLRQYLSAQGASKVRAGRAHAKKPGANRSAPNAQPARESQERKAEPSAQPLPSSPVVASKPEPQPEREPWPPRGRGPRVADVKNL
jgi:hypothetical protein